VITTVAGSAAIGNSGDGTAATSASLNTPLALAVDAAGNNLYISDSGNNRIRRVNGGTITAFAGSGVVGTAGDGSSAAAAQFNLPLGIALDNAGNLYIADANNYKIRKVSNGTITTVAGTGTAGYSGDGGPATNATFFFPDGISLDAAGNLYVADVTSNRIRKISGGVISTVAGNAGIAAFSGDGGLAMNASLSNPQSVAVDSAGSLYIVDTFSNRVRRVLNTAPGYQVAPVTLSFATNEGGVIPDSQQINLSSAVPGLTYTASANAPWLSVTPSGGGSIPTTLQVNVDPTGVAAGNYNGTVTITTPNATPPTTTVAVSFNVQSALAPQLSPSSSSLSFGVVQGGTMQTGQLQVFNSGGGTVPLSTVAATASGGNWLSVSASANTAKPSSPVTLTVNADPGTLAPGTYQGTISLGGAGATPPVTVTLSVAAPTAIIRLSQTGLSFKGVMQGGAPLPQTFGVLNAGQGAMRWSATASTLSGGPWLQISPSSGTVTQPMIDVSTLSVSVDTTGLAPGDYYGQIKFAAPALNSPQLLTVILSVLPTGTVLAPEVSPSSLVFTSTAGISPASQDVLLGNATPLANSYTSSSTGAGFSYLPAAATVQPNQPLTLRVFPDFTNLPPGDIENGTITLKFADGTTRTVNVLVVVAPPPSPKLRLGPKDTSCPGSLTISMLAPLANFNAANAQATTVQYAVTDHCGKAVTSSDSSARIFVNFGTPSNKISCPDPTFVGNRWQTSCTPASLPIGAVTAVANAYNSAGSAVPVAVNGTLSASKTPSFTAGGIVHAASFIAGAPVAPCGLITVKGSNLADAVQQADTSPLPLTLNGTSVSLGDLALPMLYASDGQLNVQVPCGTPVNTNDFQLNVKRGTQASVSVPQALVVAQAVPGIFTVSEDGNGQGVVYRGNSINLAQPGNPAVAGDTVVIYCTGLGPVDPAVPDGAGAPLSPHSLTRNTVTVTIDGQDAPVAYSGLAPLGAPGVYQVNAVVPNGISNDAAQVVVSVAGQTSRPVSMALQSK
jgi:uncharacterized protein (TIGR03437 family)